MAYYICTTCGTQFPESQTPPSSCPICSDQRQYIGHEGQQWTTLADMRAKGMQNKLKEYEPGLTGIGTEPSFAIGERALLVQTDEGNILWDCITYLDGETIAEIQRRGGLQAITISHPHFYTTMIDWANQFDVPIYLHEANRKWVMRSDPRIIFWSDETYPLTHDITLVRLGGHFSGSTVLHWKSGSEGRGALLTGDTITVVADRNWVSFMYSYPNLIPLPVTEIRRIRDTVAPYPFERLYGGWFEAVVAPQCAPRGTGIGKQVYRGAGTQVELTTRLQHSLTINVHISEVFAVYSVRIATAKGYSTSWKTISVPGSWSASGSAQLPC